MKLLISIIDCKIAFLNRVKKYLTGEAKLEEDYKRWTSTEEVSKWAKENEPNKRNKSTKR